MRAWLRSLRELRLRSPIYRRREPAKFGELPLYSTGRENLVSLPFPVAGTVWWEPPPEYKHQLRQAMRVKGRRLTVREP